MIYKHKIRYALIIAVIFMTMSCFADKVLKEKRLDKPAYKGYASLVLKKTKVEIGKKFSIDIRFTNECGGMYFYNPFFNTLIPSPAKLAIYNSRKEYIGDLLNGMRGISRRTIDVQDWMFIPSDCYAGTSLSFTAGYVPGTKYSVKSNLLSSGEYYLQMIYTESFISSLYVILRNPKKYKKDILQKFYKDFKKKKELFSSNIVKIIFVRKSEARMKDAFIATRNSQPTTRSKNDCKKR